MVEGSSVERRYAGIDWLRRTESAPTPHEQPSGGRLAASSLAVVAWLLQVVLAAASMALIAAGTFYLIEKGQARTEALESIEVTRDDLRDAKKKLREASRLAAGEACARLAEDYETWDDYLDKQARRKLKTLMARCEDKGGVPVQTEP